MITLRCKCGEAILWTSQGTWDCVGCDKCQTTFAGHPDHHRPLQPHDWDTKYHQNTGKPFKMCKKCGHIDKESYLESKNSEKQN